ncbi:unnamed protein product [Paramecium primaurelia]|uniref:Uncharacterized protein n=1 Tax=Paramecium primaurelia TaxID=5886 RepID=A0A8S1M992_PARPR|nr:unnamed protein product [Paramecium primaurelia]
MIILLQTYRLQNYIQKFHKYIGIRSKYLEAKYYQYVVNQELKTILNFLGFKEVISQISLHPVYFIQYQFVGQVGQTPLVGVWKQQLVQYQNPGPLQQEHDGKHLKLDICKFLIETYPVPVLSDVNQIYSQQEVDIVKFTVFTSASLLSQNAQFIGQTDGDSYQYQYSNEPYINFTT